MKSEIFDTDLRLAFEDSIAKFLNSQTNYISGTGIDDPRSVGGAIHKILEPAFNKILGEYCTQYFPDFSRKAMEDFAFVDRQGNYVAVDVKTHRSDTKFNMPNLTSVEKLSKFYMAETNYLCLLLVTYGIESESVKVTEVNFVPIEFLSWNCLTIGALGWGQIQIKNSNNLEIVPGYPRSKWMIELCERLGNFYPKEVEKILEKRVGYFEKVREFWEGKPQ